MDTKTTQTDKQTTKRATRKASPSASRKTTNTQTAKITKTTKKTRALPDFKDTDRITVLKPKDITRRECFHDDVTVRDCITAQGKAGFHGRRRYIRQQVKLERIAFK